MKADRMRLVVLGMMGRMPFGGQTWTYLNWLTGLAALGHDVWYLEDDSVWFYNPVQNLMTSNIDFAAAHVANSMKRVGLDGKWAIRFRRPPRSTAGLTGPAIDELYRTCDALLSIGGVTDLKGRHPALNAAYRIYIETDPVTAELRIAGGDRRARRMLDVHHALISYGENYGAPDCGVPLNGYAFGKIRQPVNTSLWPAAPSAPNAPFTTIGNYRQSGNDVEWNGSIYRWSKHHEWERFIQLPGLTRDQFELALVLRSKRDRKRLEASGWRTRSPLEFSLDVFGAYQDYFRTSKAEFTVAKDQNVRLRSGWFSERDACYLATGRPVVAQATGFENVLPTGRGLLAFSTLEEAAEAVEAVSSDYERHCAAARDIAEEYFSAPSVARQLLERTGLG